MRVRKLLFLTGGLLTLAVGSMIAPQRAEACGGCFIPPGPPTVVSGHRMVMSISQTQSVLWDQIQYAGEPEEFAWVLPVKPGARVEAATAAFFEMLEGATATRVVPPFVNCGGSSNSGCGFVAQADAAGDGEGFESPNDPQVEVVHQGTVGPYETVTLSTEEPGALNTWLELHGYNVDETSQPIIDAYVEEGFDFIALRLQPGKGIQQMTPVRVVMEGATFALPLRMVSIGTGAQTPLVLYVVGEGRYRTQNFPAVALSLNLLSWDFDTQESNYTSLRDAALAQHDGRGFLTSYAAPNFFASGVSDANGDFEYLTQTYMDQALANGETATVCNFGVDQFASFNGRVHNPCPAGEPWDSPACGSVAGDELDARMFGCKGAEDISIALEGMQIEDVWVTRMEANLPRAALADDLTLEADSDQTFVSNLANATIAINPEKQCGGGVLPRTVDVSKLGPNDYTWLAAFGLGSGALALAYRRRRKLAPTTAKRSAE